MTGKPWAERGPFLAANLRPKDRHELSQGNAIYCAPTGGSGARGTGYGFAVIDSDPLVESAGIDAGFSPEPGTLRAPDVSVGVPDREGWIAGVPPLALEYAGGSQDEDGLQRKIADLLEAGTRWVWVIRLIGPRRVEVYEPGREPVLHGPGEALTAPGVLQNPVPVEALWDRSAAHDLTLRNLLSRAGYASLDAVREEAREEGRGSALAHAVLDVLAARSVAVDDAQRAMILACREPDLLARWLRRAATVATIADVLDA